MIDGKQKHKLRKGMSSRREKVQDDSNHGIPRLVKLPSDPQGAKMLGKKVVCIISLREKFTKEAILCDY